MSKKVRHSPSTALPAPPHGSAAEKGKELDHIIFFSDAVFAIAMTVLVLDLKIPALARETAAQELPRALRELLPRVFDSCSASG